MRAFGGDMGSWTNRRGGRNEHAWTHQRMDYTLHRRCPRRRRSSGTRALDDDAVGSPSCSTTAPNDEFAVSGCHCPTAIVNRLRAATG